MTQRITEVHDIPLPSDVSILHPERVLLRFQHGATFDVGAFCYLVRDTSNTNRRKHTFSAKSLSNERIEQVRKVIKQISEKMNFSGIRSTTLETNYRNFKAFIDWCDSHNHHEVLADKNKSEISLNDYSEYLIDKVGRNLYSINTAGQHQRATTIILQEYYNDYDSFRKIRYISQNSKQTKNTHTPSESSQTHLLAWSEALFNGISKLVLENCPYPFQIILPESIKCFNKMMWVFPLERITENFNDAEKSNNVWDYNSGKIFTASELYERCKKNGNKSEKLRSNCREVVRATNIIIEKQNSNIYTSIRVNHACLALSAFFLLFLANTGFNLSQAISLDWDEELALSSSNPEINRQGFRQIKGRANNKTVNFEIGVNFFSKFKIYLKLRKFILNGRIYSKLFININTKKELTNLDIQVLEKYFNRLMRFDPQLPKVRARQWRAAKQDFAITNLAPHDAAVLMQHSLGTAMSNYSNGTENTHHREMGAFLKQVGEMIVADDRSLDVGRVSSLGLCSDFDKPKPIEENLTIQPDCNSPEGCLFCDKYRVHADAKDARKLLSCRHCLRATSTLCGNEEIYKKTFGEIFSRIEFIINELRIKDSKMIEQIEFEVDTNGELDPYWSIKFQRLIELGIV